MNSTLASKLVSKMKAKSSHEKFLDPKRPESMFLQPSNKIEIEKIINSLGINKSSDIYGMSSKFLKILSTEISETLSNIFNELCLRGFPDHTKLAILLPYLKEGLSLMFQTTGQCQYYQPSAKY